jgi:hypothetical protein
MNEKERGKFRWAIQMILVAVQHNQLCKSFKSGQTRCESGKPMIIADFPTLATS